MPTTAWEISKLAIECAILLNLFVSRVSALLKRLSFMMPESLYVFAFQSIPNKKNPWTSVWMEALDCLYPKTRNPTDITVSVSCFLVGIRNCPDFHSFEKQKRFILCCYFDSLPFLLFSNLLFLSFTSFTCCGQRRAGFYSAKIHIFFHSTKIIPDVSDILYGLLDVADLPSCASRCTTAS